MGSVPFICNITQTPAFTVPLFMAFRVFLLFFGTTEGIVLFARELYTSVAIIVSIIVYFVVKKYTKLKMPIISIAFLFLYSCTTSIFTFNYNSVALVYLPLVYALIFVDGDGSKRNIIIRCVIATLLAIRVVFATPQAVVGLIIIFIYLCVKREYTRLKCIIFTGLISATLILAYLIGRYGHIRLLNWINLYLNQGYFLIKRRYGLKRALLTHFLYIVVPVCISIFICFTSFYKKYKNKLNIYLFIISICISLISLIYVKSDLMYLSVAFWYLPYVYWYFKEEKTKVDQILVAIGLSYTSIFIFASITNIYGFAGRYYWLLANIFLYVIMIYNTNSYDKITHRRNCNLAVIFLACMCIIKGINNYQYIYRDDKISNLTTRVESGIWKGIYTTKERSEAIQELEKFIYNNTDQNDRVFFLDWASFGYMMSRGSICAPSTLDVLYHYDVNIDNNQYIKFFENEQTIPTKIIYIDFGRDPQLSIEDDNWKFNDFVNENYSMSKQFSNSLFRVKIYSSN